MIFSIIIPTYNEEEYLPVLLDSIKEQDFDDYEIMLFSVICFFFNYFLE